MTSDDKLQPVAKAEEAAISKMTCAMDLSERLLRISFAPKY
jgi:hypothetical protein